MRHGANRPSGLNWVHQTEYLLIVALVPECKRGTPPHRGFRLQLGPPIQALAIYSTDSDVRSTSSTDRTLTAIAIMPSLCSSLPTLTIASLVSEWKRGTSSTGALVSELVHLSEH